MVGDEVIQNFSQDGEILDFKNPDLPNNPDYIPGQTITASSLTSGTFCLDDENHNREYNHCGPNCGDGLTLGGGTPINGIDSCCRAHDRCFCIW